VIIKPSSFWKTLLALPWLLLALCAAAQGVATPAKDAPNLLFLEMRLDQHVLADALPAYQYGDDVYLPLAELARLLTLAIRVEPLEGRASGYILAEQRGFSVDVMQLEATIEGRHELLDRSRFKLQPDDMYVASRLLARWLPLDLAVDLSNLALRVTPRETLPLQARLQRLERGSQPIRRGAYLDPGYPRYRLPYSLADTPFIDQTMSIDYRSAAGRSVAAAAYSGYLTADLLGMEAALHVSSSKQVPSPDLRFTIGRNDPDAGLLGPLHARTVMLGNVTVPGVPFIALGSVSGNGAAVSNRPLSQPASFDRHTLQGDLPPGWDVELYFNDALVAFQQSRPDGKYSFDDLPLIYGPNEFRLVFHGPLGQLRIERQSFLLEQSVVAPGQLYYNLSGHRDLNGRTRALAQFDWGLSRELSATGGFARLPTFAGEQGYTNLGLRSYLQSFILSGGVVHADNGGALAQASVKTRLGGLSLSASRAQLRDFSSELFLPTGAPIRSRDEVRADGLLPAGAIGRLPVSLQVTRDKLVSGQQNVEAFGRVSLYRYGTAVSNGLRWQSYSGSKFADGIFQASRRVAGIGISGQLQYGIEPHLALSALSLSADKNLADGYLLNLGVTHAFQNPESRLSAALNKSLGSFGMGLNAYYSSRGEFGAGIALFVAMGVEPRQRRWVSDAQPMAAGGAASMRVFLDKNLNGVMDGDDEPIKGAGFTLNGGASQARTGADGIAYLPRLAPNQNVDIGIDPSTLEDPQWLALQKGVRLVPRAGKVSVHDFPVSISGEIDGTTYMLVNDQKREAGDLELELVDANGKVVATTKSAADGYFVVPGVVPGNYLLRISRAQLARLGLSDMGMHLLTIAPDGAFVNGREFYVAKGQP
jgi:hypothetical protein